MAIVMTLAQVAVGFARSRGLLSDETIGRVRDGVNDLLGVEKVEALTEKFDGNRENVEKARKPVEDVRNGAGRDKVKSMVLKAAQARARSASAALSKGPGTPESKAEAAPEPEAVTVDTVTETEADLGVSVMMTALSGASAETGAGIDGLIDGFNATGVSAEADAAADLMLRAILQAAKADGEIDAHEREIVTQSLGDDPDPNDLARVKTLLDAPVDVARLAADTPRTQAVQVYSASVMALRLDTPPEAIYLHRLAEALSLDEPVVNALHQQMDRPALYRQGG